MASYNTGMSELTAPAGVPENSAEQDALAVEVLTRLAGAGFFPARDPLFPASHFHEFDTRVRSAFSVPHTTMTPLARRVLFGVAAAQQPRTTVVLGTFVGYAAAWLFGPALPPDPLFAPGRMVGCDLLEPAVLQARSNFDALRPDPSVASPVELVVEDAYAFLDRIDGKIDLLYLDVDSDKRGKRDYLGLLERAEEHLADHALVLAHDVTHPFYVQDVAGYQQAVRDRSRFRRTATLRIDPCGLEITLV